ncbi:DUF4236 domain-containing protein [Aquipseudomonas alcaligenes]|uniref:DUF4236 domain-containing protein n=1 Tax=Aquipseudomonas alcaligenes TaxID=43263 RepID=UPI001659710D|nr:DUF4236 domain-containing protein [Pseudomonas alcaligenes]
MALKFRKRIKIAPGIKLNITSKGVSSVSLGGKGGTVNLGKSGVTTTASIPGTGISYSKKISNSKKSTQSKATTLEIEKLAGVEEYDPRPQKSVGILLGIGIFMMPYIFSWVLLQQGYSKKSRIISFAWLGILCISYFSRKP